LGFNKIAIIGLGLIGSSLAAAFQRKNTNIHLIGIDENKIVEKALERKLINEGYNREDIHQGIRDADLVILAVPVNAILKLLPVIAPNLKPGALITDVGSTKRKIVETASQCILPNVYFLGGHPMTGSEKSGLDGADPFLFENAVYVLTESEHIPKKLEKSFADLIESIGAKVILLPARLHDEIAAVISHLPQMLAVALMKYVSKQNEENEIYLKLAAGGFQDMTRIASSPYGMWEDICKTNHGNIKETITQFIAELETIKDLITEPALETIFDESARNRLSIPKDTRGFLRPHFDISVVVEDKPGMISSISTVLAQNHINIKDIEVLKVREGDAGTLRLSFESENDRERAISLLLADGFQAQKRD